MSFKLEFKLNLKLVAQRVRLPRMIYFVPGADRSAVRSVDWGSSGTGNLDLASAASQLVDSRGSHKS